MGYMQNNIVSPFAMHQQQLAMLAQQQSLLMAAAAAKSSSGDAKYPANVQQPGLNIPIQNWPAASYPIPGVMPVGSQGDLQKIMQVIINVSF
jgi:stromal membrane-associated protein